MKYSQRIRPLFSVEMEIKSVVQLRDATINGGIATIVTALCLLDGVLAGEE